MPDSNETDVLLDAFVSTSAILADLALTDAGLRKRIRRGVFPPPDCNVAGRNLWKASTYRRWKQDALAGKFAKRVAPPAHAEERRKAA